MKTKTKYLVDLFAHKERGEVVIKSWVFENDAWGYRELTPDEVTWVLGLQKLKNKAVEPEEKEE